ETDGAAGLPGAGYLPVDLLLLAPAWKGAPLRQAAQRSGPNSARRPRGMVRRFRGDCMTSRKQLPVHGVRRTTLNVRVWDLEKRRGDRGTTYRVRWRVGTKFFSRTFKTRPLADSFRADIRAAMRRGEGFDAATGQPVSTLEDATPSINCYQHLCEY